MLNKLDYSYNDEISIIHRINPVIKLFGLFIYVLICLLKYNNYLFIANLSFIFLLMLLSNVNILRNFKLVWKFKFIILIMYVVMYHYQMSIVDINIIVFKFIFFLVYLSVIYYTTTKEEIGIGLSKIVNIFNLIGIDLRKIASFFTNIITSVICFFDTLGDTLISGEIKGNVYTHSNIIDKYKLYVRYFKKVYKSSKDKMKKRKNDMKYKLYNDNIKKRYKYGKKLGIYDYLFILINIGFIVFYILKVR